MKTLNPFKRSTYWLLKTYIFIGIMIFSLIFNLTMYLLFDEKFINKIFDFSITCIITIIIIWLTFRIIEKKEQQLNSQVDQLTEAYQYIGQINRKIDSLLDLEITSLDKSHKMSQEETFKSIFHQLINLISASAGYLYLKPPFDIVFEKRKIKTNFKSIFEKIIKSPIKDFKYAQNPKNIEYFKKIGFSDAHLKNHNIITKPVYMHNQEIGMILIILPKSQQVEDRDLNIIRVFSFYLALNATFKPDFSIYKS